MPRSSPGAGNQIETRAGGPDLMYRVDEDESNCERYVNRNSDYGTPFFALPEAGYREKRGNPPRVLKALRTASSVANSPNLHLR